MKLTKQEDRVDRILLTGARLSWMWAVRNDIWIADIPRVVRKLRAKGKAVKDDTIKTRNSSYMEYFYDLKSLA